LKENDAWLAGVVRRLDDQNRKIDEAKAKTEEWRLKVREIELGGDHAYSTLHQWLGELATRSEVHERAHRPEHAEAVQGR
jgi:hypothetical protein